MKHAIAKSSELGLNCWLPVRLIGECFKCDKYTTCKYSERVADAEFDTLLKMKAAETQALKDIREKIKNYGDGRRTEIIDE